MSEKEPRTAPAHARRCKSPGNASLLITSKITPSTDFETNHSAPEGRTSQTEALLNYLREAGPLSY